MNVTEKDCFNLSIYQQTLFQDINGDSCKVADIQRKCTAQILKAACNSLNNSSTCDLLDRKLSKYSASIYSNNKSIYDNHLKNLLSRANTSVPQNIKSNLDNLSAMEFVKAFPCSLTKKNSCDKSELPSHHEFDEFLEAFRDQRRKVTKHQSSQLNYFKEKQPFKNESSSRNIEARYSETSKEGNYKKENFFRTARDELQIQNIKKYGNTSGQQSSLSNNTVVPKRKLGTRRNINSKFISPLLSNNDSNDDLKSDEWPSDFDERLKNIEPRMVELIKSEIMDCGPNIHWNDIAGLEFAKTSIQEAVVWPLLRPDIFTGLRRPPKGNTLVWTAWNWKKH
ncbi:hypothetical protein NQ318_018104 [Aromia moschata]|uniref:Uncharacterized protein n=1 Tax=Aromia moschata TaxID=1265417 RepID=A0AAV8ZEM7_9CUCU|nr:hypothetical protein NQ318_018104 [Aromia moschata]